MDPTNSDGNSREQIDTKPNKVRIFYISQQIGNRAQQNQVQVLPQRLRDAGARRKIQVPDMITQASPGPREGRINHQVAGRVSGMDCI